MLDELRVKVSDPLCWDHEVTRQVRPARKVQDDVRERFVERGAKLAETVDPAAVAQRLRQGAAECKRDIFDRVVVVDPGVSLGADVQVEQAVRRDLVEHVVEEPDGGVGGAEACAVQIDPHLHARFFGLAADRCGTGAGDFG